MAFFFSGGEVEGARWRRGSAVRESFRVGAGAGWEEKGHMAVAGVARSRKRKACIAWPETSMAVVGGCGAGRSECC